MSRLKALRTGLWIAVAVALVGAGLLWWQRDGTPPLVDAGSVAIGGPFTLVDGTGKAVTDEDLRGRPFAIFFGFTRCPDICPTALWEMTTWIEALGDDAERMRFVFVTIDPERDTPETMQAYVGSFTDRIQPLTGTPEQVAAALKVYRVYARKVPLDDGDYTMDHSTMVYLMDEEGRYVAHIPHGESEERAVALLRTLLKG